MAASASPLPLFAVLPDLAIDNVLNNLDMKSIGNLGNTCRSMRQGFAQYMRSYCIRRVRTTLTPIGIRYAIGLMTSCELLPSFIPTADGDSIEPEEYDILHGLLKLLRATDEPILNTLTNLSDDERFQLCKIAELTNAFTRRVINISLNTNVASESNVVAPHHLSRTELTRIERGFLTSEIMAVLGRVGWNGHFIPHFHQWEVEEIITAAGFYNNEMLFRKEDVSREAMEARDFATMVRSSDYRLAASRDEYHNRQRYYGNDDTSQLENKIGARFACQQSMIGKEISPRQRAQDNGSGSEYPGESTTRPSIAWYRYARSHRRMRHPQFDSKKLGIPCEFTTAGLFWNPVAGHFRDLRKKGWVFWDAERARRLGAAGVWQDRTVYNYIKWTVKTGMFGSPRWRDLLIRLGP
ncbi:hypothetical protein B0T17DRAFT_651508 [Bombardia bombarda]|uniref:F-box domain-containing protein n=1 Tax=Bombardia bombarda TaxID=252184 RepID=A0AA39XMK1_9PEZI|nr:hypothetical protein B0T17DRAFT_651508 [Bombardia bombarda]